MIYIATDGSCSDYKKKDNLIASFSTVIKQNDKIYKIIYGIVPDKPIILNGLNITSDKTAQNIITSHNRGELLGIIMGMIYIIKEKINDNITFICDSEYCINMITQWMYNHKEYKNNDMINILRQLYPMIRDNTHFIHQPSHTKDTKDAKCNDFEYLNKLADEYAKLAITENNKSYKVISYL